MKHILIVIQLPNTPKHSYHTVELSMGYFDGNKKLHPLFEGYRIFKISETEDIKLNEALIKAKNNINPLQKEFNSFWCGLLVAYWLQEASRIYGSKISLTYYKKIPKASKPTLQ